MPANNRRKRFNPGHKPLFFHLVEKFEVRLAGLHAPKDEFHGFDFIHRMQEFAQIADLSGVFGGFCSNNGVILHRCGNTVGNRVLLRLIHVDFHADGGVIQY